MTLELGILLALLCAVASNLGNFLKHRGCQTCVAVNIRHPLFVLAGGVVLIAVMADRSFGMKVGRRQWIGLALTAAGLALFALTMPVRAGAGSSYSSAAMITFEAVLFGIGGLLVLAPRAGAPAGALPAIVTPWHFVAMAASFIAFYASARSFQDGTAVETIAITGTAANVACIAGGIIVFGDPLPGSAIGIALQAVAFVMIVVASALTPAPAVARDGGSTSGRPAAAAAQRSRWALPAARPVSVLRRLPRTASAVGPVTASGRCGVRGSP